MGVVAGAQLTVVGASEIAERLGLAEGFIGLTLIALGHLAARAGDRIAAARKGEDELIIGNLLGSNLFNSLAVGATAGLLGTGTLDDRRPRRHGHVVIMVTVAFAAWLFIYTGRRLQRTEAMLLLAAT